MTQLFMFRLRVVQKRQEKGPGRGGGGGGANGATCFIKVLAAAFPTVPML